ncbi:MAG TPA: hypothetical protein VGB37_16285 [Candidatus Lokiarchaeia archaeon]
MFETIKQIPMFLVDVMIKGFYFLPFLVSVFFVDRLKFIIKIWWVNDTVQKLAIILLTMTTTALVLFVNMMAVITLNKLNFNVWLYLINFICNSFMACGFVEHVDKVYRFIEYKFTKRD